MNHFTWWMGTMLIFHSAGLKKDMQVAIDKQGERDQQYIPTLAEQDGDIDKFYGACSSDHSELEAVTSRLNSLWNWAMWTAGLEHIAYEQNQSSASLPNCTWFHKTLDRFQCRVAAR